MTTNDLTNIARKRRADTLRLVTRAGAGHIGGDLSCMDILVCLYYDVLRVDPAHASDPERDRFLLSKGHSNEAYLTILADRGFLPTEELLTYGQFGSRLIGHPNNKIPGVEMCSGALGHGLPVAVGMALGAKRAGRGYRTYVVMGDGEQAEGSIWEAAMAAAHYRLDNLCAVVDRNGLQISGSTENVLALDDLADKWRAFGWSVTVDDGHDMARLQAFFHADAQESKPRVLIARTVKGKGVPWMENRPEWHHKVPTEAQFREALTALGEGGDDR